MKKVLPVLLLSVVLAVAGFLLVNSGNDKNPALDKFRDIEGLTDCDLVPDPGDKIEYGVDWDYGETDDHNDTSFGLAVCAEVRLLR